MEDYSEEDELDDIADPRITEMESEDEAPKLVEAAKDKKKNKKRPADESDEDQDILDKILKKDEPVLNGEQKLSKKQKKKLKNNAGHPADAPVADAQAGAKKEPTAKKDTPTKDGKDEGKEAINGSGKKVQFADKLVQEPPKVEKKTEKTDKKTWTTNGVKIDERKVGTGPKAKKGVRK